VWIFFDHDLVSYMVGVRNAFGILSFVVVKDMMLLSFLDVVPVVGKNTKDSWISTWRVY
jgi:hypothetical protein